jgi:hypothetical protein
MEIIIGDKKYDTWDEPQLPSKRSKVKTVVINFRGKFQGPISDIIVISKYKYQWVLKGCELIKHEDVGGRLFEMDPEKRTRLTISFKERSGSHIKEVIKSEIRDWNIEKLFD